MSILKNVLSSHMAYQETYQDCLSYIDSYWDKITFKPTRKEISHHVITIPHPYITPNDKKFDCIYYWDTYFMFQGLKATKREWLMQEMVKNFAYLFETYHIIPNVNAPYGMGRSQPPFFSSMIVETYQAAKRPGITSKLLGKAPLLLLKQTVSDKWFASMITLAKQEYTHVWVDLDCKYHHSASGQRLSRYGDRDVGYAHSSELESGWDFTSRFYNRCDEFLPIDLNVYLAKYELDFAKAATMLSQAPEKIRYWENRARVRIEEIQKLMWNDEKGFFFDYHYPSSTQSDFLSLAGFTPLWAGLATYEQAKRMKDKLPAFETAHGLTISDKASLAPKAKLTNIPKPYQPAIQGVIKPKQWDYPHIWPPLEYLTVTGLLRYGFIKDAKRIMEKSLKTHAAIFRKYGTFFEKIDGVKGDMANSFHYPNQSGFGWTNAIFSRYVKTLDELESSQSSR